MGRDDVKFTWHGDEAKKAAYDAGMAACLDMAEHVLELSQNLIPHDTGTLERTGTTDRVDKDKACYISFNTPYARRQHEELDYQHKEGRQAKYLESPLMENAKKISEYIGLRIKLALKTRR